MYNVIFLCEEGVVKNGFGFGKEEGVIIDTSRVVPEDEFADLGFLCYRGSVRCGGMLHLFAACRHGLQECGLMVKRFDSFDDGNDLLAIHGVRAIGVAFTGDVVKSAIIVLDAVGLFKEKSAGRYSMFERDRLYGDGAILKDHLVFARVDGMKDDVVLPVVGMIVQKRREQFLQVGMRIYVHRLRPFEHAERGEQTDESEAMITMQMGYEDVIQPPGVYTESLHRQQYSFAAIDEEGLIAQLDQLPGRGSGLGRLCTAAS